MRTMPFDLDEGFGNFFNFTILQAISDSNQSYCFRLPLTDAHEAPLDTGILYCVSVQLFKLSRAPLGPLVPRNVQN